MKAEKLLVRFLLSNCCIIGLNGVISKRIIKKRAEILLISNICHF